MKLFMDADISTEEPGELVEEPTSIGQRGKARKFLIGVKGVKFFAFRNYWKLYASVDIAILIFESRNLTTQITQYVNG